MDLVKRLLNTFCWGALFKELNTMSYVLKFFTTAILQVFGGLVASAKLMNGCSSSVNALIVSLVVMLISVAVAISLFFIPVVYALLSLFLSIVFSFGRSYMIDAIIEEELC